MWVYKTCQISSSLQTLTTSKFCCVFGISNGMTLKMTLEKKKGFAGNVKATRKGH